MKLLVVGGGGREHALVDALAKSPKITQLFCAPGNGGIGAQATCVDIKATDIQGILGFVQQQGIEFVVVAPDDPLALGLVDKLSQMGVASFGPSQAAARIESSKVFAKNLMQKYAIPTAKYKVFSSDTQALGYIQEIGEFPVVIKADGLALGKGVVIPHTLQEAEEAIRQIMQDKIFGDSGNQIVVEEFITGPEVSVLAFCDGKTILPMVSSMDHKRALDGNQGPNTGGMGTIAPNPHYTPEMEQRCMQEIFLPTVSAMALEGAPFKGCLYFGLMLTPQGPKVIEYNCRFGDPETQVVLPLLETDLLTIFQAIWEERLEEVKIRWKREAAACVVMASGGYPGNYQTGYTIHGLGANGQVDGACVYHAGTRKTPDGSFCTAGGRVLGVTATGKTLEQALDTVYSAVKEISFTDAHFRIDIGKY